MADKRISQLIERTDIANNDVLPIVASGATTTNKVTISTIQDWMQDNLDVGVTSVGITLGTSGTDVNVSGSPITTSGNITINIPDASATARGVVNTGTQTFAGIKYFNSTIVANQDIQLATQGTALSTFLKNINATGQTSIGSNGFGFNNANNIYFSGSNKGGGILAFSNTGNRTYTLQDASGTLAFTSDLGGYVTLDTAQTITAQKTFTTSGSSDTMIISHGSGSGIALDVIKAGNGEGIRVTKTSGSGNAVTISGGNFEAPTIVRTGGTSTQYLMADGSVSTLTNPITGTGNTNFVPKFTSSLGTIGNSTIQDSGSEITLGNPTNVIGALNGTSASFSGASASPVLTLANSSGGTKADFTITENTGLIINSYESSTGRSIDFRTAGISALTLSSTGAATFSSSVTAANNITCGTGAYDTGGFFLPYSSSSASSRNWKIANDQQVFGDFSIKQSSTQTGLPDTTRFYIGASGSVGIGTASPSEVLHIFKSTFPIFKIQSTSYNSSLGIDTNSGTLVLNNESNAALGFNTNNTERMRITSGGDLLVGMNSASGASITSARAGLFSGQRTASGDPVFQGWNQATSGDNQFVHFYTEGGGGSFRGSIDFNRAVGLVRYNTTSDANLKNIIGDSDKSKSVEILNSTKIREYSWKEDETNKPQIGVIAQELHETFKGAVSKGSDDELLGTEEYKPWAVDKTAFTFHLIAGFQEHERIIKELKAEIDSLKTK